jgi:CheY-like chemotaxis protein
MGKQRFVLIVEDEPDVAATASKGLEMQGYEVTCATTRDEALKIVKSGTRPDMILLDLYMPGMTAEEFIEELLKIDTRLPRIVLMTAAYDADDKAKRLGIPEVLRKPFAIDRIVDDVEPIQGHLRH